MLLISALVHGFVHPGTGFVAVEFVVAKRRDDIVPATMIGQGRFDAGTGGLGRLDEDVFVGVGNDHCDSCSGDRGYKWSIHTFWEAVPFAYLQSNRFFLCKPT